MKRQGFYATPFRYGTWHQCGLIRGFKVLCKKAKKQRAQKHRQKKAPKRFPVNNAYKSFFYYWAI